LHELSGFIDEKSGEREAILITNNDGVRHIYVAAVMGGLT